MKRSIPIVASVLLVGAGVLFFQRQSPAKLPHRHLKLIITGAEGQHFTGNYVSDGVTNTLSAVVPATIGLWAMEATYEFLPGDDREEFRVALNVEEVKRTSFVSYRGKSVRGGWRSAASGESAW